MKTRTVLLLFLMMVAPLSGSESSRQLTSGDEVPFTSVKNLERESGERAKYRLGKRTKKTGCCLSKEQVAAAGLFCCLDGCKWYALGAAFL